jgi:hypothetical protein
MTRKPKHMFERPAPTPEPAVFPLEPGTVTILEHLHDHDCKRPQGGVCTCRQGGPEIRVVRPFDPERN